MSQEVTSICSDTATAALQKPSQEGSQQKYQKQAMATQNSSAGIECEVTVLHFPSTTS